MGTTQFVLGLAALLLSGAAVAGAPGTYYVSPTGDDEAAGGALDFAGQEAVDGAGRGGMVGFDY